MDIPPWSSEPPVGGEAALPGSWWRRSQQLADRFLGGWNPSDANQGRRARLIANFGFLGCFFGSVYAAFYFAIGHPWGAWIIVVCSLIFLAIPYLLRATHGVTVWGNAVVGVMMVGFTALCAVEGGMDGHAIAWLVSVPLCALLLLGKRAGLVWMCLSLVATSGIVGAHLLGLPMPKLYPERWHSLVTGVGYLGLIGFMFLLGMIFELGRAKAFGQMRQALKELEVSHDRLVYLNQEKNEFLGIAAHDLKNPLTIIVGNAQLMPQIEDRGEILVLADDIQSAATRMNQLIKSLLDANAIEEGRFTSKVERCDLTALVQESVRNNSPNAQRKQISIRVATEPGVVARADAAAVVQILDNLLSNAIKYSPLGSQVEVFSRATDDGVVAAIRDQGPGLSAADQAKLFRKFTRLTAKPTGGESSTGLGLSIVKRLAEAMAGTVECTSTLGEGATFSVRLPRWESGGESPGGAATAPQN